MDRRERLWATINGEKTDRIITGFWYHFPAEAKFGENAVKAHINYYEATNPDMLKVMNEHMFYIPEEVKDPEDWTKIKQLPFEKTNYPGLIDEFKEIKRSLPSDVPLFVTIHGVLVSAYHATSQPGFFSNPNNMVSQHLRMEPENTIKGLDVVADTLIDLVHQLKKAGCEGIYYAALGDEEYRFDDETFNKYVKPYDYKVLNAIKDEKMISVLHICKDKIVLPRYADTQADIINWGVHDCKYKLSDGRKLFPNKTILGGFDDRTGVLCDGTKEDIEAKARSIVEEAGRERLIVGADCTLPDNVEMWRINVAQDFIHKL